MTSEDIKQRYSMREIVERYGFRPNRSGFISCPFHSGDESPSLKVYKKDFHCHACGANGDIFTFVMRMDNLTFKEAFTSLGGIYQKPSFASNLALYRAEKRRKQQEKEEQRKLLERTLNQTLISIYRIYLDVFEPLSDEWCESYNKLQIELYKHEKYE